MAKTIKFNLKCNDVDVRNLEGLRNNFCIEDVIGYYESDLLQRWLRVRGYTKELEEIEAIKESDSLTIIKKLVEIFEVEKDSAIVEENTYIFQYKKKHESNISEYKRADYKVKSIISDYHEHYNDLIKKITDNNDDMPVIKAAIKDIDLNYDGLFDIDYRDLFYTFAGSDAPMAVFAMLMNENMRKKLVFDTQDEYLEAKNNTEVSIANKDKLTIYNMICSLNNPSNLEKILRDNLKEFVGETAGYWKDIEFKGKKCMILCIPTGTFVQKAEQSKEELSSDDINNAFVILDGIRYKSHNAQSPLLYLEV